MDLQNIGYLQRRSAGAIAASNPILFFENRTQQIRARARDER
jgi:hypothetical protein